MYLTIRQHDTFRTLLMGFEIPYRAYIADIITSAYSSGTSFEAAMSTKKQQINASSPSFLRETLTGCNSKKLNLMYQKFVTAKTSVDEIVTTDIDIPVVGALNLVTFALVEYFQDLYVLSGSYTKYCDYAEAYRYARNKLDHPGCRTLEDSHLVPVLSFVNDILIFLDDRFFLQKKREQLLAEVKSLQQRKQEIPIKKHNLVEIPFPESRIVCRENEINKIKDFVYGRPGDLRKRHSLCIYGYGGVGKTCLVVEAVKQIVRDIMDNTVINDYSPQYVFFFSAKKRKLTITQESGKLLEQKIPWHFETADEVIHLILASLERDSFRGFHDEGLIIIDNLESLKPDDRKKVKDFIDAQTPAEMQFIITSRNSEEYESNQKLAGFEADNGHSFISTYSEENSLGLSLTNDEVDELISLSKGNTLVLVLSLRRLSAHLLSISALRSEFDTRNAWKRLRAYGETVPSGTYEVIAEFMFKDTFEHLESIFANEMEMFYKVLKVFAIIQSESVDIGTICLLTDEPYPNIEEVIDTLCGYLIIEKKDMQYSLNGFAEKYIITRFMPDSETYSRLSAEVASRQRRVLSELEQLQLDMDEKPQLRRILKDWLIVSDIDRISAAKMYRLYGEVNHECYSPNRTRLEWALERFQGECMKKEKMTAHPFVRYQEARILQLIDQTQILSEKHEIAISKAYEDCIYAIKTIEQYSGIQQTKSYASLLWLYGQHLNTVGDLFRAMRFLEESRTSFESLAIRDQEYYQSLTLLGETYLKYYLISRTNNLVYLRKARQISIYLQSKRDELGKAYAFAMRLKNNLTPYGQY